MAAGAKELRIAMVGGEFGDHSIGLWDSPFQPKYSVGVSPSALLCLPQNLKLWRWSRPSGFVGFCGDGGTFRGISADQPTLPLRVCRWDNAADGCSAAHRLLWSYDGHGR